MFKRPNCKCKGMAAKQVPVQWNLNQSALGSMHEAIPSQRFRSFPIAAKKNEECQNKISTLLVLFLPKLSLISPGLACMVTFLLEGGGDLWFVVRSVGSVGGSLTRRISPHPPPQPPPQSPETLRTTINGREEIFGALSIEAGAKVFVDKTKQKQKRKEKCIMFILRYQNH